MVALERKHTRQRKCISSPLHGIEKEMGYSSAQTMQANPETVAAEEEEEEEEEEDSRSSASLSRRSAVFCRAERNSKCSQNMVKYSSNWERTA